ncbi:MAG TPA: tetratricopeptide repeat protein [Flavisolibacter sp.]
MQAQNRVIVLLICALAGLQAPAHAQRERPPLDVLLTELQKPLSDTAHVRVLTDISMRYSATDTVNGLRYAQEAMALAEKTGDALAKANATSALAATAFNRKQPQEAIRLFQQAIHLFLQAKNLDEAAGVHGDVHLILRQAGRIEEAKAHMDTAMHLYRQTGNRKGIGTSHSRLGLLSQMRGNNTMALEHLFKAAKIAEEIGDKRGLLTRYGNIGVIYMRMKQPLKAIEYYQKSLPLAEALQDKANQALSLGNTGVAYVEIREYDKAHDYLVKALKINEELGNKHRIAATLHNLGEVYFNRNDYVTAYDYYTRALQINREIKSGHEITNLNSIGLVHLRAAQDSTGAIPDNQFIPPNRRENLEQALSYLSAAYDKASRISIKTDFIDATKYLAETYTMLGQPEQALRKFREYTATRDSMLGDEKQKEIMRIEMEYSFQKKEDSLKYQQLLAEERLKQQTLMYEQQQQSYLLQQNELDLARKENQLQQLAIQVTKAELDAEQSHRNEKEQQLFLVDRQRKLQDARLQLQQANITLKDRELQAKQKERNLLVTGAVLLFLVLGALHFIRLRIVNTRKKEQLRMLKAEAEMKTLRAQMNPHFIFNCLNTIDYFIHKNKPAEGSRFLHKFASLIRRVLDSSREPLVPIENDIEALELYIQLEQHRNNYSFDYAIDVDGQLKDASCKVPPLLIQPFVENAILHGLRNKREGKGYLRVSYQSNGDVITCRVDDNGVGRKKAALITGKTGKSSLGLRITEERLAILRETNGKEANFRFEDKSGDEGTVVNIILPKIT